MSQPAEFQECDLSCVSIVQEDEKTAVLARHGELHYLDQMVHRDTPNYYVVDRDCQTMLCQPTSQGVHVFFYIACFNGDEEIGEARKLEFSDAHHSAVHVDEKGNAKMTVCHSFPGQVTRVEFPALRNPGIESEDDLKLALVRNMPENLKDHIRNNQTHHMFSVTETRENGETVNIVYKTNKSSDDENKQYMYFLAKTGLFGTYTHDNKNNHHTMSHDETKALIKNIKECLDQADQTIRCTYKLKLRFVPFPNQTPTKKTTAALSGDNHENVEVLLRFVPDSDKPKQSTGKLTTETEIMDMFKKGRLTNRKIKKFKKQGNDSLFTNNSVYPDDSDFEIDHPAAELVSSSSSSSEEEDEDENGIANSAAGSGEESDHPTAQEDSVAEETAQEDSGEEETEQEESDSNSDED